MEQTFGPAEQNGAVTIQRDQPEQETVQSKITGVFSRYNQAINTTPSHDSGRDQLPTIQPMGIVVSTDGTLITLRFDERIRREIETTVNVLSLFRVKVPQQLDTPIAEYREVTASLMPDGIIVIGWKSYTQTGTMDIVDYSHDSMSERLNQAVVNALLRAQECPDVMKAGYNPKATKKGTGFWV